MQNIEQLVRKKIHEPHFNLGELAHEANLSERQLQRRIKKITGLSPIKYIREVKLQKARELLEKGDLQSIAEVAYAIGFDTPYYFGKLYEERFGRHPGDYIY